MTERRDIVVPRNALSDTLTEMEMNRTAGRMGGGSSRMGPPPTPTPEEIRAQVERDWGPAGEVPPPHTPMEEPPPAQDPPGAEGRVSPVLAPSAGPFRYIDLETFSVVTREGEYFPIKDMNVQKGLMMVARDTVWFATNDKFIAMSKEYGLPLPQVQQQSEAPDDETEMPAVLSAEKPSKVSRKKRKGKMPKVPPTQPGNAG